MNAYIDFHCIALSAQYHFNFTICLESQTTNTVQDIFVVSLKYKLKVKTASAACISKCMLLQPSCCHELASPAGMQATWCCCLRMCMQRLPKGRQFPAGMLIVREQHATSSPLAFLFITSGWGNCLSLQDAAAYLPDHCLPVSAVYTQVCMASDTL